MPGTRPGMTQLESDLLAFFADRLKVHLRERARGTISSTRCFALPGQDDLLMIVRRVEALGKFLDTDDGKNLLAGYQPRRQHPARRGEEGRRGAFDAAPDPALLQAGRGARARRRAAPATKDATAAIAREDFEGAMRALSTLRAAGRCVLRQGDGERRRSAAAREQITAAERTPPRRARGRGFCEDRGRARPFSHCGRRCHCEAMTDEGYANECPLTRRDCVATPSPTRGEGFRAASPRHLIILDRRRT